MSAPETTASDTNTGGPKPRLPRLENWSPMVHAEGDFTPRECLRPGPDTNWVFERAMGFVEHANRTSYRFELAGFTEPLQVAEYGPDQF